MRAWASDRWQAMKRGDTGLMALAGVLARVGGVGRRDERAELDLREIDHRNFGRQDARDLDQVDVADAGREKRVVERVEGGAAFGVTGSRRSHRDLPRHSLLLN